MSAVILKGRLVSQKLLHVAVGVIRNARGELLISKRARELHQGGLWEFAGGKVERGESVFQALKRELFEELAINVSAAQPLIKVQHHYSDLSVLLDVWDVTNFSGIAKGREGQQIKWVKLENLNQYDFPEANQAIIKAVQLPRCYAILDDEHKSDLMDNLEKILKKGIRLIQARLKTLTALEVEDFLKQAIPLCQQYKARLLINSAVKNITEQVDGIHFTSSDLMALKQRPKKKGLYGGSCHNLEQLQHAEKIGLDFIVLAPVLKTQTHPNVKTLGWQKFSALANQCNLPAFALGGLETNMLNTACHEGAQGIAGIRAFLR